MLSKIFRSIHKRLGDLWWYTILSFCVNRLGDLINLYIGIWLVPKYISPNDLGAVNPLISVAAFVALPITIFLLPVQKFLNVFSARGEYGKVRALLCDAVTVSLLFAAAIGIWLFIKGDGILERMHISDRRVFIPMAGFALFTCIDPVIKTAQRSLKCFNGMVFGGFVVPVVRLLSMFLLLSPFGVLGYLSSQLLMNVSGTAIGVVVLFNVVKRMEKRVSYIENISEMVRYSLPLVLSVLAGSLQVFLESFVIRHRLPCEVSEGFYYPTIFGAIPGYATAALTVAFWPIVSDKFEKGESTKKILGDSMIFNILVGGFVLAGVAFVMPYVFSLNGPWAKFPDYSKYVWQVGLITILKSVHGTFFTHQSACRSFRYIRYVVPLYLAESALLYCLPAWEVFRPYLPSLVWNGIDSLWTLSLQSFLTIIIVFNSICTLCALIDWRLGIKNNC